MAHQATAWGGLSGWAVGALASQGDKPLKDAPYKCALHRLKQWVFLEAIPVWSRYGIDPQTGAALGHLCGELRGALAESHWVANQARVAYAFAQARFAFEALNFDHLDLEIFRFVSREAVRPSRSDGYVHSLDSQWRLCDQRYFLADHCWFILAGLAAYKAFGRSCHLRRAINIQKWLTRVFRRPDGTYLNCSETPDVISVESQLALVEALIALYEATQRQHYLTEASLVNETLAQRLLPQASSEPDDTAPALLDAQLEFLWLLYRLKRRCPSGATDKLIRRVRGRIKHLRDRVVAESCPAVPLKRLCRTVKLDRVDSAAAEACLAEILARVSEARPAEAFECRGGRVSPRHAEDLFELTRIFEPLTLYEP